MGLTEIEIASMQINPPTTSHATEAGVRLYRLCLWLYPSGFRRDYGRQMLILFRDCLREAQPGGAGAVTALWGMTMLDVVTSVPRAHIEEWSAMQASYTRSSQIGAICAFVATVLWLIIFGVGDTFATFGGILGGVLVLVGMAATFGAVAGLYYRLAATEKSPFTLMGGISGIVGLVVLVGGVGVTVSDPNNEWGWYAFMSALGLLALAFGLMGFSSSSKRSLGPLRFAPLLTLGVPIMVVMILFFYASTSDEVGRGVTVVTLILALLGILGTGALLWTKSK
jgi:hypothetical protein